MRRLAMLLLFILAGCDASQPESARTVAAIEVPLPTEKDKTDFLDLLAKDAVTHGYHLDTATPEELAQLSTVSPISLNATVWRGEDEEAIASAMDSRDHIGRIWLTFSKGKKPEDATRFREALLQHVRERWPDTRSLPIMPTGAIPNAEDLNRTPAGYVVKPSEAAKYNRSTGN
ncbi:hypothetical protein QO010_004727 [Caulobacter ginsengisoli]|uniref:Uncharacterized protein n=1 Tax=Caulobacter ginsengisoli TaxID=400775 RepID=A0ABU0IY49_9CAUL|nr:hypothetical protein [Caulobacter ginsengisoli]MDQ0466930.1 hypothetical protein [Caulobacter ginsengisoli]